MIHFGWCLSRNQYKMPRQGYLLEKPFDVPGIENEQILVLLFWCQLHSPNTLDLLKCDIVGNLREFAINIAFIHLI